MFETSFRIRSTQVDQFGHLNHAVYLELFEWARWEWGEAGGLDFRRMIAQERIGPVIVRVEVDYRAEVRFHERVRVSAALMEITSKMGHLLQRMHRPDGKLAAEARIRFLTMDLQKRRVVGIPQEFRDLLEAPAGN